ncbi:uncharacterized protein LOC132951195 [Metopolophium dirhodum]|uniref:uncharacterized protein LOC132936875 n=1 Tax=Metopolophium dirhodum TaxID=44670 RepID=UPI00298F8BCD|nr:uncharacterized protein LOC132936875 [Metopolophium dirhodum]XP_060861705.1 uncharacterized protein LOC132938719 [Metopolophium dirhodum]XP_060862981.1 uncharacterized protein LOC132939687 [Metopolophium dirhodum]XP_060866094.1 uncharacterized protein LOC132941887 [Metopolophium dirhodum]XP_060868891.1 uncharacterized protein LOC132943803 [Metopolophium dirhodum]XP_060874475.1 uncharacterized protein LOC132948150 [Metopolophium dirhodum]XP_060876337.1 uncharacterized protein LOC132949456 [
MDVVMLYNILEDEADEELLLLANHFRNENDEMFSQRSREGCFSTLIQRRLIDNETRFRAYFRVSFELFNYILNAIKEDIRRRPSNRIKKPISPEEKLSVTLRFLATGESYRSLAFQFRISHSWISTIIREVLVAICHRLKNIAIPEPTQCSLSKVANDFYEMWNFPNCCGAIDGKHIRIVCPDNSGSLFFNYKSFFSIVLLALVDANNKFLVVDIGSYGKEGDAGIFPKSNLGKSISTGEFKFPEPKCLPNTDVVLPHVFVGDEAFKLTETMMRPYPRNQSKLDPKKAIFNYRLSRARRTTENTFGIMCQYFRVFFTPINILPDTVDNLIMAACIIHNMLREERMVCPMDSTDRDPITDVQTNTNMIQFGAVGGNATHEAFRVRETFKDYFNSRSGSVSWQQKHVTRTN